MFELMTESSFSAAHQLRGYNGPCENLHGHTFKVQLFVNGSDTGNTGMVLDFKEMKRSLAEAISDLDHSNLNELEEFKSQNPTAENLARLIFTRISGKIKVSRVTVWESPTACATYLEK
ncbi:MAG: 6-carboxytetrahydropterin synthase QueD [Candidatus Margulisiibacteriota bacterium]